MEINIGRKQPWSWYLTVRRVCVTLYFYTRLIVSLSLSLSLSLSIFLFRFCFNISLLRRCSFNGCFLFPFLCQAWRRLPLPRLTSAEHNTKNGSETPDVSTNPPLSSVASDATSLEKARTTCSERRIRAKCLNGRIYFCLFVAKLELNWQQGLPPGWLYSWMC